MRSGQVQTHVGWLEHANGSDDQIQGKNLQIITEQLSLQSKLLGC